MKMMRTPSGISLKSKGIFSTRSLSSLQTSETPVEAPAPVAYINQRVNYETQLTELKKGWRKQMQQKLEREALQAKLERERIVLRQAVRLRQDRAEALITQEKIRLKRELAIKNFRQHLADNEVVREKRQAVQQCRFSDMVRHLHDESAVWVTKDNIEDKITNRLFDDYATTGLVSRSSNYWRYMTVPYNIGKNFGIEEKEQPRRSKDGKYYQSVGEDPNMTPFEKKYKTSQMRIAENLLNTMISTGEERANYDDYLFRMGSVMEAGHKELVMREAEKDGRKLPANFDPYNYAEKEPVEISRAEWLVQKHKHRLAVADDLEEPEYDENDYVEANPDDEVEEVVILPPKPLTTSGTKGVKNVKRVPRKR